MEYDLVFEGGGAKGTAFAGAMLEFFRRGHSVGRLLGTSAGAISATLLAAGYSAEEMLAALAEKVDGKSVFASFLTPPAALDEAALEHGSLKKLLEAHDNPLVPEVIEDLGDKSLLRALNAKRLGRFLLSFIERGGIFSADGFVDWLQKKLNSGQTYGVNRAWGGLTLAEFSAATQKDLTVVASDTTAREMLVLNARTAPNLPVLWAVRMSMSVPLLWQEVVWQPGWGAYRGKSLAGHSVVDGGLLSNFPLELFVSDLPSVTAVMGPKTNGNTLGLLLDDDGPVPGISAAPPPILLERFTNLLNTALEGRDKTVIAAFDGLVARLPCAGYSLTEFEMSDARREALLAAGQAAMEKHLDRRASRQPSFGVDEDAAAQEIANALAERLLKR
ncbi:MAG: patatin-like phospholipase family protein [Anaerolineales bacterium]